MSLIKKLSARLQNHPKRIVYPDGEDVRIIASSRQFATRKLGVPILLGNKEKIEKIAASKDIRLDGIRIIDPKETPELEEIKHLLKAYPKFKRFEDGELNAIAQNPDYFASIMLASGRADAMVTGANNATSASLRTIFEIIPLQKAFKAASSMMVVSTNRPDLGVDGDLFLSDCGVVPEPSANELCDIAVTTAILMNHLTLKTPKVAMLSYVSKSQVNKHPSVMKVKAATALVHERSASESLGIEVDGELQVDAALCPEIAQAKGISSSVAGKANVLIFPDLDAGNITSKMIQIMGCGNCYGKILTGLSKPVAEISRGATCGDIFGTSVLVGAQAVDRRFLSLEEA